MKDPVHAIKISHLEKYLDKKRILHDVSLDVFEGEIF